MAGGSVGQLTVAPGTGFGWQSIDFSVADPTESAAVALRFTTAGGPDSNIRAAYVEYAAVAPTGHVVVVGPTLKVRPADSPAGQDAAALQGAANEFVAFQIVVPGGDGLIGLTATVPGPLEGPSPIPASNVRLYRVAYYGVKLGQQSGPDSTGAGQWPDPLVPAVDSFYRQQRNAFPIDIPKDENRVIWVDILVPPEAPPGDYSGSVRVATSSWQQDVAIRLHVIPFVLPSTATLRSAFSVDSQGLGEVLNAGNCWDDAASTEACWRANEAFLAIALDHRTTLANAWLQDPDQNPAAFQAHLRPYLDGNSMKTLLPQPRMTTLEYDPGHLPGWLNAAGGAGEEWEAFVYLRTPCDEIYVNKNGCQPWTDACLPAIQALKSQWPSGRVVMTIDAQTSNQCGVASAVNNAGWHMVIAPVIDYMEGKPDGARPGNNQALYPPIIAGGNELWLYASCDSWGCGADNESGWASYAIDAAGSQNRAMSWLCFLYGATGELYWQTVTSLAEAWNDGGQWMNGGNGDGNLFYPGLPNTVTGVDQPLVGGTDPVPIESIRLKLIRAGRQDYEYLNYLAAHGQGNQAKSIAASLFPNTYTTIRDDTTVEDARGQLLEAVAALAAAASHPTGGGH